MATPEILEKIKLSLRISHNALDADLEDLINACLADLQVCGIPEPDPNDALILNAVKLYVRAHYIDDTGKGDSYMTRYNDLKSCLMMAEGYGGAVDAV